MLFKYRYNLKSYLELSLGEGFSDIVVLVRSPERSDDAISIIIELKAGKTLTIQGTPFDQAGKYAEAFKYGPQRMITNNDNVIYAVYNPDLPNNRIKIDKTARDKQHPKPFLQSVLESADPAQIREQLKYIYYSIPNLAENYYRYTSEVLLGELMPTRTKKEVWNKYIFKHEASVSNDITSFGFVNSGKNELVLLNIIRGDSRSKKINIDEVIGKNKEVNVKLGMHESIRGNRNLKIREVNLLLETKKARAGEFKNWCQKVQVNSYDNLNNYNTKKTQSFSGEFAKLDIDVNKLKNMLDNAVDKKGTGAQSDNAEHYKKLFTEVSSTVFPIKEMINNEIDFQAILHGLFMYYSDSQMSGGSKKRIGVIPEVQSGGGKRIDIGVVGGEEFTGIELKFSETQGIADGLTTKAKEAESQLDRYKKQPNNVKSLTDSERAKMFWAVFHKGARTPESLIETRDKFDVFQVVHSSMHVIPHLQPEDILEQSRDIFNQQCNGNRKKRNINMACIDSRDEEKITEEEKEQRIKELFNADKVVEKVKNIEFYDQLFKVSQRISKGEIIDKNVEEAFAAKIKDVDLDSIDSEIRDIVKGMRDNIENKEEVKNILRRSGVAEKIGKVAEGAGLAFTVFLVGKHIANGDIEGLGYDALNLWVMPKIGEKISGKILELGTKLDSQMLKGFAPVMGRAIGNFAAFLGLAESIKVRQNATDPVDIKIADLNIATNSIFIAADVPAVVTETMSAMGMEAGIIGEFAGPVGAAVSVAVIIISQFVEAELEVEKLEEHINLTDQEKHDFYWDFFLGKKVPDYIENDIEAEEIYKQYIPKIIDKFNKDGYTKIAISMPSILVTKEEYATNAYSRNRRQFEGIGHGMHIANNMCRAKTKVVNNGFDFESRTNITHPFYTSSIAHNSRIIPSTVGNYNVVCGPRGDDVAVEIVSKKNLANLPNGESCSNTSQYNNMKLSRTVERWFLQEHMTDCYNAVSYNRNNPSGPVKMLFYMSNNNAFINVTSNYTVDVIFNGKNILLNSYGINNQGSGIKNRYYFTNQLSNCDIHKQGTNFFYIVKDNFVCNLGGSSIGQNNIVVTRGNFTDSENIHSIIGSDKANHIEVSHAGYVDGKGGNDVVTAKSFTTIKGYFGDSIYGKGLVLLPINFNDVGNITHVNNITNIYNKSGAFISVDKQTSVKTADGLFVIATKIDDKTGAVTNLHVTKSLSGDVVLDDELDNLRKIDNSNFNITKQLSSANYHSAIGSSSNHIFYPDKEHHNFYWEAPSNISHLYLFDNRNANITIAQANGILDFSQLNCTLDDMPFTENNAGEIKINKNGLHVTLLPDYKDVTVTFDGQEYYKLQDGELERDYCSHSLRIDGRFSVNGTDLLNHHNCFTFDSEKVLFLKLNNNLLLLSDRGALSISDYYSSVNKNWDLSIELNNRIMEPEEFGERADDFSSFRYYKPDEQGLQIYHNQPINKNDIGLVDFKGKSVLDFDMKVINDTLLLLHKNNTLVKVENWNTYQPAREVMLAFNDAVVSNSKCIASTCNSEDIVVEFNKEKAVQQLFDAVKQNNLGKVKELIDQGASINAADTSTYGKKPIHIAAENNNKNIIEFFLSRGVSVNDTERVGNTPLHYAAWRGGLEAAEFLVDRGASINAADNSGKKPVHVATENNNKNVIEFLLSKGVSVDEIDKNGWTPLHYAAWRGGLEAAEFLVGRGASINAQNVYGREPIHIAAEHDSKNIIELLLNKGVSVNEVDKDGWTPLHWASWNGHLDIIEYLVGKGANINAKNRNGKMPLDIARDKGHDNVVEYLQQTQLDKKLLTAIENRDLTGVREFVSQGASVNAIEVGVFGRKPIHIAAEKNYKDIIEFLLGKGVSVDDTSNYGWTPLHYTASKGCLEVAKFLVDKGANINPKNVYGREPIHIAAEHDNKNIIELLLNKGVSINEVDKDSWMPLHWASWSGHLGIIEYLIGKGANINAKDKSGKTSLDIAKNKGHSDIVTYLQQIRLSLDKQLFTAVQDGSLNKVKDLVGRGANLDAIDIHDATDDNNHGWTPILYAAKGSKWDIVKFLIVRGAKFNNEITYQGTPLHFAVQENDLGMVQFLLNKGAKVESEDSYNRKPLHLAAEVSGLNIMKLLLDNGANVDAIDMYRQTPLYFAIDEDKSDVVKLLLDSGANVDVVDVNGQTPLYLAKQERHAGIVKILEQAKLNQELLTVTKIGDLSKVRDSLKQGADINAEDKDGNTPLHNAASKGYLNVVKYLIEKGASLEAKDHDSRTPIYDASWNGHLDIVKCLIEKGVNVNATDKNGWTLLHGAASKGNLEIAKSLIEKGADINAKNIYGKKPIHRAAEKNYETVIELLLSKGANVNDTDKSGWTPLHWASQNGHLDVVKYLVNRGAEVNAKANDGKTPLDIAIEQKHNNVVEYLEKVKEERGEPLQRKRRHHHGDHSRHHLSRKPLAIDSSNQPEIAASSGTRPSSWINGLFGWVKGSVGGLFYSRAALSEEASNTASSIPQDEQFAKASVSSSSSTSTTLPSDGTDKKQENGGFFRDNIDYVNANIKQMRERQTPVKFKPSGGNTILEMGDHYLSHVDFNDTIMLLDLLIRKVTGQKYISTVDQSISPLEAQGYALNITNGFEKVLNETAIKSGISVTNLNFDPVTVQSAIVGQVISKNFSKISKSLYSFAKEACPEFKQTDKFLAHLKSNLEGEKETVLLQQKVEKPSKILDQQVSGKVELSNKPDTLLNGTSVVQGISRAIN